MVTFLEPEEPKSEDEEETTYHQPPVVATEKPKRHKLESIRQLHAAPEPPTPIKRDKRYDPRERFNPLVGLLIMISATLVAIFTMAILLGMKKNSEETRKAESMNPYMEKAGGGNTSSVTDTAKKTRRICDSPECITLSYQLLNWRDPAIDPCDDFYQATCGKHISQSSNQESRLLEKNSNAMKLIIEHLHKNTSSSSRSEIIMRKYYQKCESLKNEETFQDDQDQGFHDLLNDIEKIGSWPLVDHDWEESKFDLNDMLEKMAELGVQDFGLFKFAREGNDKYLYITAGSESNWMDKKFVTKIHRILHVDKIEILDSDLQDDIKHVQDFIKTLSSTSKNSENSDHYNLTTLKSHVPSVDFEKIIKSLVPSDDQEKQKLIERVKVEGNGRFFGQNGNLENLLKSTSPRTLANFLVLKYISTTISHVPTEFKDLKNMECGATTVKLFPQAAANILSKNYRNEENLKIVSDMVEEARNSYVKMINESTWLHEETKENMISKLKNMKKTVGYPEDFEETGASDKTFEALNISPEDSWYTLVRKALRFQSEQSMRLIANDKPMNSVDPSNEVNAFYKKHENSLSVIVPIIDSPIFNPNIPKYAKLASNGISIAKEMSRVLEGTSGWKTEDQAEQKKRSECLERQENEFDSGKMVSTPSSVSVTKTLQLGIESLWNSFKKLDLSNELLIPGYHDTDTNKLFFQIYAINFCSSRPYNPNASQLPSHYRVNGVLSNMKSFSDTFNCSPDSPMNPTNKCVLL